MLLDGFVRDRARFKALSSSMKRRKKMSSSGLGRVSSLLELVHVALYLQFWSVSRYGHWSALRLAYGLKVAINLLLLNEVIKSCLKRFLHLLQRNGTLDRYAKKRGIRDTSPAVLKRMNRTHGKRSKKGEQKD